MKNLQTFEAFINESWPFDNKKQINDKEEETLFNYAKKNSIMTTESPYALDPKVIKKFQSNNEERAWELFEIWVSAGNVHDYIRFLATFSSIPHDDIFNNNKKKRAYILDKATGMLVDMIKNRKPEDLLILKKMEFYK